MMRRFLLVCAALLLGGTLGCQRQSASAISSLPPAAPPVVERILGRIHFKGFDHLATGTNGTTLLEVWKLPESQTLRTMALDKLAPALAAIVTAGPASDTNSAALMRPLLEDLLRSECVVELIDRTNLPPAWALALRLDEARQALWRENAAKLKAASRVAGGSFALADRLTNGWLAVAYDSVSRSNGMPETPLFREIATLPASVPSPHWLRADFDWPRLTNSMPTLARWSLPGLAITVEGKGDGLRTEVRLSYAQAQSWALEPWQMPTNTIRDPLIGFTAVRGLGSWLKTQGWFTQFGLTSVPNQFVAWGQSDTPYQMQIAAPIDNATNALLHLLPQINARLKPTPLSEVRYHTNAAQISGGLGHMLSLVPYLRRAPEPVGEFLNAGLFPVPPGKLPPPPELLSQLNRTNLVYYDWEITQARLDQLREIIEVAGLVLTLPPMNTNSVARRWVDASGPRLGNCATEILMASPQELSLVRRSHLGFTALELIALANWIEGPHFPGVDLSVSFRQPLDSQRAKGATPATPTPKP